MDFQDLKMEEAIDELKVKYLLEILGVNSKEAVTACYAYASYLNKWGVHPDNFFLFLEVMGVPSQWAVDALTNEKDLIEFLEPVIPNYFIVENTFKLLYDHKKGTLHEKVLVIITGLLKRVYKEPTEGYELYPITVSDLNHMAKHLIENSNGGDINKNILSILSCLSKLVEYEKSGPKYDIAKQAAKIRMNFFDSRRSLEYSLTEVLLEEETYVQGDKPEYIYE